MVTKPKIRVMLVDDHEVVRLGLRALFTQTGKVEVVAEAGTVADAIAMAKKHRPDLVLMDLRLPDGTGLDACREILSGNPGTRVLFLTSHSDEEAVTSTILAGAAGYVVKGAPSADLITAVRAVARNQHYVHPVVASVVVVDSLRWLRQADRLTPREIEVLRLLTAGRTAAETGQALGISAHTVRRHIANVTDKAGVHGRVALTRYALEHHLVQDET